MLSKTSTDSPPTETRGQPPRKRSRLLGDIDLNSPEVQKLLKAGSSHASAVNEVNYMFYCRCCEVLWHSG